MKNLRVLFVLLVMALFAGILSACGTDKGTDKQKWQDTIHLQTYEEVKKVLGEPDAVTKLAGTQYRDVSFVGVSGIYEIGSYTAQHLEKGIITRRDFCYVSNLEGKTVQNVYDESKNIYETILNYLNETYGKEEDGRWSYSLKDGSTVSITVGCLWNYEMIEEGTLDVDTSSWKSTPATELIPDKDVYEAYGNRLKLVKVSFNVKSPD